MHSKHLQQQQTRHTTKHTHTLLCAATNTHTDAEQKLAISNTDFANLWRRAVQHNPFVQAFMLNFGAIGMHGFFGETQAAQVALSAAADLCLDIHPLLLDVL